MLLRKLICQCALLTLIMTVSIFITACDSGGGNQQRNFNTSSNPTPAAANTNAANSNARTAKVNINTASEADLLRAIPNLGNRMLHEFEEYRPYRSIQQFRKEIGKYVDQAQVADYEKYVFVPIDENQSDAPTLQQIPGLDAGEAQELIAGRPYAARDAFLSKLAEKVSPDELAIAKTYLVQR